MNFIKKNQLNYTCAIYYTNILYCKYEEQAPNKEYYVIGKRYFSEGTVKIGGHWSIIIIIIIDLFFKLDIDSW